MSELPIVLGTSSKYRRKLFSEHFTESFTTLSPSIDEKAINAGYKDRDSASPTELTLAVAHAKASALLPHPPAILLTSDQVVTHRNRIREKPSSTQICREYLKSYKDEPLTTVTAVVVVNTDTGKRFEGVDIARQWFEEIPDPVIDKLIEKGDVMQCSGGITAEAEELAEYRGKLDGEFESIQGLPVALVRSLLKKAREGV